MITKIKYILKQRSTSKWIIKLATYLCLLFGLYSEISESKIICGFLRAYCIFISSLTVWAFCVTNTTNFISYVFVIVKYVSAVVVFIILHNDSFIKFNNNLEINDRIMGFKEMPYFSIHGFMFFMCNSIIRTATGFSRNTYIFSSWFQKLSIGGALFIIEINMFGFYYFFSIFYERIKLLRKFLGSNVVSVNITGRDEVAVSIRNVKKGLYYYDKLLDGLQCINMQIQMMVNAFNIFVFDCTLCYYLYYTIAIIAT
ncbi:hypothetical protein B5X24_HaOG200963 [Helicoverpa armigera]|nr:hypothetical protein B5X24_HaOG200963 [Helicoverpa armigera]